jgi:hypothetical protein
MKLGTQTASLTNHIMSRAVINQPTPVVGMGATILCWTDRHAGTITKVETIRGRVVLHVQEDNAQRIDKNGMSEMQEYAYTPNPNGYVYTYRQSADGSWQRANFNEQTKRWRKIEGEGLRIGERCKYHDFGF